MINPKHKGWLHRALGIAQGKPIPTSKLEQEKHSKNPHMRKMDNFALVARTKFNHPPKETHHRLNKERTK